MKQQTLMWVYKERKEDKVTYTSVFLLFISLFAEELR